MDATDDDTATPARAGRIWLTVALVLAAAFAFGAADQYVGSRYVLFATALSGLSAPFLLLPFAAGAFMPSARSAAGLGVAASWTALAADVLMIDSPVEGAHLTGRLLAATTASQWQWFAGAIVSGSLYGLLGHRWRIRRSWLSALLAAMPLLLEPAARLALRQSLSGSADLTEAAAGLVAAVWFAAVAVRFRRPRRGLA